jgi:hypothetical protein
LKGEVYQHIIQIHPFSGNHAWCLSKTPSILSPIGFERMVDFPAVFKIEGPLTVGESDPERFHGDRSRLFGLSENTYIRRR